MKRCKITKILGRIFNPVCCKAAWINYCLICAISCLTYFLFQDYSIQWDYLQNIYVDHANVMSSKYKKGIPVYKYFEDLILLQVNDSVPKRKVIDIIECLTHYEPSVIGVDIFFDKEKKQESDTILYELYKKNNNIVLGYDIEDNRVDLGHLIKKLDEPNIGYLNFEEVSGLVTHLNRYSKVQCELKPSFATKIAELYLGKKIKEKGIPLINYQIDFDQYGSAFIDTCTLMGCRGKIVIIGYESEKDIKKTAYGDYYGDVIQACSVVTIISDELHPVSFWKKYLFPVLGICLYVFIFIFILHCILKYNKILFLKDLIIFSIGFASYCILLKYFIEFDYYLLQICMIPLIVSIINIVWINVLLTFQRFKKKQCDFLNFWSNKM